MVRKVRLLLGTTAVAALVGCVVAPASRADTVIITEMSSDAWFGINEGPSDSVGEALFTPGPEVPPAGVGSATLRVDDNGRASFGTNAFKGTPLAAITQLTFSEYSSSESTLSSASLQFDVDYDSTDTDTTYQGRLVFQPSGAPTPDAWVDRDAIAGTWWSSRDPGKAVCPQSAPCTWSEVLAAFPNASIRDDLVQGGALLFRLGGPIAGGSAVSVDNFTFTSGFPSTTIDFEPGASVNPSIGPAGSEITITAYGFRPDKNARAFYYTNNLRRKRIKICRTRTSLSGVFKCTVLLPIQPDAGPVGVHDVRVAGPRRISYTTAFVLSP